MHIWVNSYLGKRGTIPSTIEMHPVSIEWTLSYSKLAGRLRIIIIYFMSGASLLIVNM